MTTPQQPPGGFGRAPGYGAPQGMPQAGPLGAAPGGPAPYGQQPQPGGPAPYGQPPHPVGPVPYAQPGPYGIPQQAPTSGTAAGRGCRPFRRSGRLRRSGDHRRRGRNGGGRDGGVGHGDPWWREFVGRVRCRAEVPDHGSADAGRREYKLAKDISQQAGSAVPSDGDNEHNVKAAGGQYSSGTKSLVMLGLYGTIDDPETTVDHTIRGMTRDGKTEVAVTDKEFTPSGGGDSLTCGVDERTEMGQKVTLTFCVWADSSTSGNVAETDASELSKDPYSVDLQEFADKADKIRSEVRKPLG